MIKIYYYKVSCKNDDKLHILSAVSTSDFYSRLFKFYGLSKSDVIIEKIDSESMKTQLELEL